MEKVTENPPERKKKRGKTPPERLTAKVSCQDCYYDEQDIDTHPCDSCHTRH